MTKANELKINNIALYKDNLIVLLGINTDTFEGINEKGETIKDNNIWLSPITLTEEWLVKLGFVGEGKHTWWQSFYISKKRIGLNFNYKTKTAHCHDGLKPIKYIHQLQNLYFALTGEELTIKP